MRTTKIALSILTLAFVSGCSSDHTEDFIDRTETPQDASAADYPKATGAWIEARTFMMKQEDEHEQGCDQVDFRVMANSGVFSVNECDKTKSGQLTADEFKQLDTLTTRAYQQTESMVCPELFRFNKFYATINATDDESDRNFDPDRSCYDGTESVVKSYKNYLRQLLNKYQGSTLREEPRQ